MSESKLTITMSWWTDQFSEDSILEIVIIIIICFVCVAIIGCLCACIYVRNYRGRIWKDPCVKCQLIDMGEMTCHTGLCPGCGGIPPSLAAVSAPVTSRQV